MTERRIQTSRRRVLIAVGSGLGIGLAGNVGAQDAPWPNRAIRTMVGYPPGGGADVLGRILATGLSQTLKQSVVIENRPGAGATLAAGLLASAPPDGYTLYMAESAVLVGPSIYSKVAYNPTTLTPVTAIGSLPYSVVVHPSFPAQSVAELIAVLKANPGKYSYASPGVGNIAHLSGELFKSMAGVDMVHIPYKGGTPALTDVMGGQVPICFVSLTPTLPLVKAGKLRLLGVTTRERVEIARDVPAISETLPGFDAAASIFMLAPPGTPKPIVTRLNDAIHQAMALPDIRRDFIAQGANIRLAGPKELAGQIAAELKSWGDVARNAGAKAD